MEIKESEVRETIAKIDDIISDIIELRKKYQPQLSDADINFKKSFNNLIDYIAFRTHDMRHIQEKLSIMGLSSLGRSERYVMASLLSLKKQLYLNLGEKYIISENIEYLSYSESKKQLETNTLSLFGQSPEGRDTYIMVSLAKEAATSYNHVCELILSGMNCARINCAHDDETTWGDMINNVKTASKNTGYPCKILMDLGGPKLRTGSVVTEPIMIHIKISKDIHGAHLKPATIFLSSNGSKPERDVNFEIPLNENISDSVEEGDKINFKDKRGKKRSIHVLKVNADGIYGELYKTSVIGQDTLMHVKDHPLKITANVGRLPYSEKTIYLKKDDKLILHKAPTPGEPAKYDDDGILIKPAHISCTLPEVFEDVKKGERILLNDGKIVGKVIEVSQEEITISITYAKETGSRLGSDKGINLPDSDLNIPGLTEKDFIDLKFVVANADIVNMSFASRPEDIAMLHAALSDLNATEMPVMFKIETRRGFDNLPLLLLHAMKTHPVGIMIARGDLAAEAGWTRLAEIQEEMLWLCEAAHIPVVWATQVLESLAQKGIPSRAEITDASMSQRAECVMLNKGPYILDAVKMLHDILKNMKEHQYKKSSRLRILGVSNVMMQE